MNGMVDALHQERQALAVVPQHDLELRKGVEGAGEHQAHHGGGRLDAEAERGAGQGQTVGAQFRDHGSDRVQIDDDAQLLSLGQDGPVALLVDVGVAEVGVGLPTLEAQLLDGISPAPARQPRGLWERARRNPSAGPGTFAMAAASSSLARRAMPVPMAGSKWSTPGEVSDRMALSMPPSSMAAMRPSPMSSRRFSRKSPCGSKASSR